jgi:hypothetical protein
MAQKSLKILGRAEYPYFLECFNNRTLRPTTNCQSPGFLVEVCLQSLLVSTIVKLEFMYKKQGF